jgi:type I restriction enzyme R subunit
LKPFSDEVDLRFQASIFRQDAQRGTAFNLEQIEWPRPMKEHIASSCRIERGDIESAQFAARGGLHKESTMFSRLLNYRPLTTNNEPAAGTM